MKKLLAFAVAGLIGVAACSSEENDVILQDPVLEETTTPVVIEPAPPVVEEPTVIEADSAVIVAPAEPI